jgi:hypothetical protein
LHLCVSVCLPLTETSLFCVLRSWQGCGAWNPWPWYAGTCREIMDLVRQLDPDRETGCFCLGLPPPMLQTNSSTRSLALSEPSLSMQCLLVLDRTLVIGAGVQIRLCLRTYVLVCLCACLLTCLLASLLACLLHCLLASLLACLLGVCQRLCQCLCRCACVCVGLCFWCGCLCACA